MHEWTNAKKGPEKDESSYKEFFDRETDAYILAKWMALLDEEFLKLHIYSR